MRSARAMRAWMGAALAALSTTLAGQAPVIPGAPYLQNTIAETAEACMYRQTAPPRQLLEEATQRIQARLDTLVSP